MDDYDVLTEVERNPAALWHGTNQIVLDEIQRVPSALSAIKRAVDERPGQRRFVLSGSANLLLMREVSETLAGRAVYLSLLPLTLGEEYRAGPPDLLHRLFEGNFEGMTTSGETFQADPIHRVVRGFMPPLLQLPDAAAVLRWWEGYVATYLERDLRSLSQVSSLPDFRRFMAALAFRTGQLLNQTEIARDTGISQPSIHRYLNLLEASCVGERLQPYAVNRTKRLIKMPKFYWMDPGLGAYLAGHHDAEALRGAREAGALLENLVLLHLRALAQPLVPRPNIYFWSTSSGMDVDFIIEWGRRLIAFEVKLSSAPQYSDLKALRTFLAEYPEASCGVLLHTGRERRMMDAKIVALPWEDLAMG